MTKAELNRWREESVNQALAELAKDPAVLKQAYVIRDLAGYVA